jgi:hypothetical protein
MSDGSFFLLPKFSRPARLGNELGHRAILFLRLVPTPMDTPLVTVSIGRNHKGATNSLSITIVSEVACAQFQTRLYYILFDLFVSPLTWGPPAGAMR